ncbi:uncharacterized protein BDR25DRAFT_88627 [Lindgomyces ingoldianus]|uniref:Uncharacterized protein n=1 Tax=Lindgomyces ingoldianus TaxID=673940 RepID=A0ACB6RBQ8_9PLEO|nr:uncharacterized protein BDR25DRAFT_88627 [Lindgomyces ingoldianus]KAF2475775.1 hypothetical protein BDR25DRAFT_88627 [Lindgomyces ingoldianus]
MDDNVDIPEDSLQHVEALLSRHPPQVIQRMFQQVMDSRRNSTASSLSSLTSFSSLASSNASMRSRLSFVSTLSTASSELAPSIASSSSSRSRGRRPEPRSYPSGLDPTRPVPAVLTPLSDESSPMESSLEIAITPTDEDVSSISSPFPSERNHGHSGDSFMFCTYCADLQILKTFKAKSDWKKHEMRMHETGEDWPCIVNGCGRIFDRQKDFVKHHQRYHSGRPLPSLTDIKIQLLPRKVFSCGFDRCKEVSIGWDERCDHVAKHMKNGWTFEQWKYTNVIRNLIRQEATHDTWKDLCLMLDERLRETRSQISWCVDNTRILRQKLECCDLRPSREDVLITALSLRSDIPIEASHITLPPGFVTPSRDSVPNFNRLTREQCMQILIGRPNTSLSRTRLAAVNAALLQASHANMSQPPLPSSSHVGSSASSFSEPAMTDTSGRRISYMDLDPADFLDLTQPEIPPLPSDLESHMANASENSHHDPGFADPGRPTTNPLGFFNYFDSAPAFEESPYYDRPSLGQRIAGPLRRVRSNLSSRRSSPHRQPSPHGNEMEPDFMIQQPHPTPIRQDQLHLFTSQS